MLKAQSRRSGSHFGMQGFLFTYRVSRSPLGASFTANSIEDGIIEMIEHRFAGWKLLFLSKGRRIILIKSALSNLLLISCLFSPSQLGLPITYGISCGEV
jgi:hypothetical protein